MDINAKFQLEVNKNIEMIFFPIQIHGPPEFCSWTPWRPVDPRLVITKRDYSLKGLSAQRNTFFTVWRICTLSAPSQMSAYFHIHEKDLRSSLELGEAQPLWTLIPILQRPSVLLRKG